MQDTQPDNHSCDFLVIGSGGAALTAALRAAKGGLSVVVVEKTKWLGGTTAMSGAGIWIPANHIARNFGVQDSEEEALTYLRASAPEGWAESEDHLWQAFVKHAPQALKFIADNTPLEFVTTKEPDPFSENQGGKIFGRQLTVKPLSKWRIGRLGFRIRPSTLPHLLNYDELVSLDPYHRPAQAVLKLFPKLVWRLLSNTRGQGSALVTGLIRGCLDYGVSFQLQSRANGLVQDNDGRVIGALVSSIAREKKIFARHGVLLATGGFEWNDEMREAHFPGGVKFLGSPSGNTGDGQVMAAQVGARLDHMDQANIYPCLPTTHEGLNVGLPMTFTAEKHSILVNKHGRRFVSENGFNIGEKIDQRDPTTGKPINLPVWLIGNQQFVRQSLPFRWYARKSKDFIIEAGTLAELARRCDLPAETLEDTVSRFNWFCDQGFDQDFRRGQSAWDRYKTHGKGAKLHKIEGGPFIAIEVSRSILGTKGGARTNAFGQVMGPHGKVISGLYAAGLAMANPFGTRAIGAGTTLGPNITWGFICAETVSWASTHHL